MPQYDYSTALNVQQPPLLDTTLELPNTSSQHVTFSSHFPLPPRNHLAHDFPIQPHPTSRLSPSPASGPIGYRYSSSSDRRLPGGHSHDHSYTRHTGNAAMSTDDRRPPPVPSSEIKEPSTSAVANSPRQARKEVSTTVIACRQWCVCFNYVLIKPYSTLLTYLPVVVAEKFVAIQQGPSATIASDGPMYASMTLFQNEGDQISVPALASGLVKNALQTDLQPLSRNARGLRATIYRTVGTLPHLG